MDWKKISRTGKLITNKNFWWGNCPTLPRWWPADDRRCKRFASELRRTYHSFIYSLYRSFSNQDSYRLFEICEGNDFYVKWIKHEIIEQSVQLNKISIHIKLLTLSYEMYSKLYLIYGWNVINRIFSCHHFYPGVVFVNILVEEIWMDFVWIKKTNSFI